MKVTTVPKPKRSKRATSVRRLKRGGSTKRMTTSGRCNAVVQPHDDAGCVTPKTMTIDTGESSTDAGRIASFGFCKYTKPTIAEPHGSRRSLRAGHVLLRNELNGPGT